MAKYIGSVVMNRIKIIKAYTKPKSRGTNEAVLKVINGEMEKEEIFVPQFNLTHAVFSTLVYITKIAKELLIIPVWNPLANKLRYYSGYHLFMKTNAARLYHSIPEPTKLYSHTNMPKLESIYVSDGVLEPAQIIEASYSQKMKQINVKWNPTTYRNGTPEDNTFIIVIHWKIPESNEWYPDLKPYLTIKFWGDAITPVAKREDSQATVYINDPPPSVYINDSTNFTIYLFFHNKKYSFSKSSATKPHNVICNLESKVLMFNF
ncbi:MAG: hypothetical protein QMD71_05740 [bacterium]|nr:hypothetical protein [bacterium]